MVLVVVVVAFFLVLPRGRPGPLLLVFAVPALLLLLAVVVVVLVLVDLRLRLRSGAVETAVRTRGRELPVVERVDAMIVLFFFFLFLLFCLSMVCTYGRVYGYYARSLSRVIPLNLEAFSPLQLYHITRKL